MPKVQKEEARETGPFYFWIGGRMRVHPILLVAVMAACSAPPAQPRTPARAEQSPKTEAIKRADALLEDLKRREAAQAKFDRENPARESVPATISQAPSTPAPPPATAASASPPPSDPTRDEAWWKGRMQSLQRALDEASGKLAEAEKQNLKNGYGDAQAIYKDRVAAVTAARQAIDSLHDDARRAGVPPSWLR